MTAAVRQWLAMEATGKPPRSHGTPRRGHPSSQTAQKASEGRTEALSPCHPRCPICTDTTPPEQWDGPWPAFRWSPDLEETR